MIGLGAAMTEKIRPRSPFWPIAALADHRAEQAAGDEPLAKYVHGQVCRAPGSHDRLGHSLRPAFRRATIRSRK